MLNRSIPGNTTIGILVILTLITPVTAQEAETSADKKEQPKAEAAAKVDGAGPKDAKTESGATEKASEPEQKEAVKPATAKKEEKPPTPQQPTIDPNETGRIALTSPPKDNLDYSLLGEFVGEVNVGDKKHKIGLQLRPIGPATFSAIRYLGGLPGQKGVDWTSGETTELVGRRAGPVLVLSGSQEAVFVSADSCKLIDSEGKLLGTLPRVNRSSPTLGAMAPADAVVIFDGTNTSQLDQGEMTEDGLLKEGSTIIPMFQDFNMHLEFRLPYMPNSEGQKRANSGCYLQSRYEVQVLDSFAQLPQFNGCSSLYRQKSPDVNACLPPLVWQTYDIHFTAPRWASDGKKIRNARITVWLNGIKTQDDYEIKSKTGAGSPEEPKLLPIKLQNHSDPVRFRNIWIVDRGLSSGTEFPVFAGE